MSHIEKHVIDMNRENFDLDDGQMEEEEQLLKVVKREERHVEDDEQHNDDVLEICQVKEEFLEYLLEEHEYEDVIPDNDKEVSQDLIEIETYASFQVHDILASREEWMNEYVTTFIDLEDNLLFGSKSEV